MLMDMSHQLLKSREKFLDDMIIRRDGKILLLEERLEKCMFFNLQ